MSNMATTKLVFFVLNMLVVVCQSFELYLRFRSPSGAEEALSVQYIPTEERLDQCVSRICRLTGSACSDEIALQVATKLRALSLENYNNRDAPILSEAPGKIDTAEEEAYHFLHIPKTAGTSMVAYFQAEAGCTTTRVATAVSGEAACDSLCFLYDKSFQNASSWEEEAQLLPRLLYQQFMRAVVDKQRTRWPQQRMRQSKTLIIGHYEMPHFLRLSNAPKRALTLLREPVARVKSLYSYLGKMSEAGLLGNTRQSHGLRDILSLSLTDIFYTFGGGNEETSSTHRTARVFFNGMTRMFVNVLSPTVGLNYTSSAAKCKTVLECDENGYMNTTMAVIDNFFVAVGIQEAFVDSMLHFVTATTFFAHPAEHKNVTVALLTGTSRSGSTATTLTELDEAIIWSYNRLDAALFLHFARYFIDVGPVKARYQRYEQLLRANLDPATFS